MEESLSLKVQESTAVDVAVADHVIQEPKIKRTPAQEIERRELYRRLGDLRRTEYNALEQIAMMGYVDDNPDLVRDYLNREEKHQRDQAQRNKTLCRVEAAKEFEGPPVGVSHNFSQALQQARVAKGMTQDQVAKRMNISRNDYQKFEKDGENRPTPQQRQILNRMLSAKLPTF